MNDKQFIQVQESMANVVEATRLLEEISELGCMRASSFYGDFHAKNEFIFMSKLVGLEQELQDLEKIVENAEINKKVLVILTSLVRSKLYAVLRDYKRTGSGVHI